jgi:hypothetical protein
MARSGPSLGSCLANDTSQGLSARRQAPGYRCPGAPGCRSLGVASPTAPPTRTRPGRDTRRQSFPLASRGSGASGPVHQPLEPTSIATKKTLEGPPGGGRSKPTQPDMQSASSAPRHHHGPRRTAARPSWTPTHVDRRLVSPNHHVPDLSHYIRDKVGPKRGEDPRSITKHSIPFHPPPLRIRSKATRRGAPRAPPLHPIIFLLSDKGEGSTGCETTLGLAPS